MICEKILILVWTDLNMTFQFLNINWNPSYLLIKKNAAGVDGILIGATTWKTRSKKFPKLVGMIKIKNLLWYNCMLF